MIGPDATATLDFALRRLSEVIATLSIYPQAMKKNLNLTGGLVFSQRVLLALTQAGVSREESYRLVQRNAMKAWEGEGDLLSMLRRDEQVLSRIPEAELATLFDFNHPIRHVDAIFRRVFADA